MAKQDTVFIPVQLFPRTAHWLMLQNGAMFPEDRKEEALFTQVPFLLCSYCSNSCWLFCLQKNI